MTSATLCLNVVTELSRYEYPDTYFEVYKRPKTVQEKIIATFPEEPELMLAIANCESGFRQEAVSPTNDFGVMQVNKKVWHDTAVEMGLDYKNSVEDNLKMARHIYEVQGKEAWVCLNLVATN